MIHRFHTRMSTIILVTILALASINCGGSGEDQGSGQTPTAAPQSLDALAAQVLPIPTAEAKTLEPLATQVGLGSPFRIDASPLRGEVWEPALEGTIVLQFHLVERDVKVAEGTVAKLGEAYGAGGYKGDRALQYLSKRGVYYIVDYTVINETTGLLKPGDHINGAFKLADSIGREWEPMDFVIDHFDGSAAFALQKDMFDPREYVLTDQQVNTILAFDIAADAVGLRLRSELLGIEVALE